MGSSNIPLISPIIWSDNIMKKWWINGEKLVQNDSEK